MPYLNLLHPEPLSLRQSTADPYLHRRCLNTVLSQSLWGLWVLVNTGFVWALWASLEGMEFDSKHEFARPTIFLEFLWPWMWGMSSWLLHAVQPPFQCCSWKVQQYWNRVLPDVQAGFIYLFIFCAGRCWFYFYFFNLILFFNFTILYWFCHISKWIRHRYSKDRN